MFKTMQKNEILSDLSRYREEFILGHSNTACLLIHGFGCGPIQMRELAEKLSQWGFTARGILLPGHCKNMGGYSSTAHHDWIAKVESEYHQLKRVYREVVVIGFSLGALLTLQLSIRYSPEKIILMGTPLYLLRKYLPVPLAIRICKNFMKKVKTRQRRCYMESEGYTGYLRQPVDTHFSIPALYGLTEIMNVVNTGLQEVRSPALVIHSKKDLLAAPASAQHVMRHLGSDYKRLVWLERSHHLVMYDKEKDRVFRAIKEFVTDA
ncbi:MAG: alpha/beta fold hydrolase [Candidatus Brocadia sp.]|nr:alpha/beta fold hydrolase [Candidatus Brocadia sp.]MDG5997683.1 alpha/beta fold hydrolase [Candidatus Brocadia sp.]UJS20528.1 MAG: alpha/beta fold hydrolase [Candidatus Brocadia sp.]